MDDGEGSGGLPLPSSPVRKMRLLNLVMIAAVFPFCLTGCTKEESTEGFFALCPLGKVDGNLLDRMCRFVEIAYGCPCKVMPPLPLPSRTYNAVRKQYRASELLDYLEENVPKGARKLVGVTEKDIYTREMNFIFGLANSPGKCCVVSTARLHESFLGKSRERVVTSQKGVHDRLSRIGAHIPDKALQQN
jgi:predicted Zn-dependent protease